MELIASLFEESPISLAPLDNLLVPYNQLAETALHQHASPFIDALIGAPAGVLEYTLTLA